MIFLKPDHIILVYIFAEAKIRTKGKHNKRPKNMSLRCICAFCFRCIFLNNCGFGKNHMNFCHSHQRFITIIVKAGPGED